MRTEFCNWLEAYAVQHENVVVLTGDLGFGALESVQARIGHRFVNVGVCEQNMVSVAAGLASEGLAPICYSIAPFAVFRPAEHIRLDVCLHKLGVKFVGNGGGYGYGIMGATHHALEDIAVLSSFQNLSCFVPAAGSDVAVTANAMMAMNGPAYFRLNRGEFANGWSLSTPFAPVRRLLGPHQAGPTQLTVVGLGAVTQNAVAMAELPNGVEYFVVSQLPIPALPHELRESIARTCRLLVIEEHVERGGLAEHLALKLLRDGLTPKIWTRAAAGYPSGRYGSQAFHQRESRLDPESLRTLTRELT